jgi:hypothetical protein
MSSFVLQPWRSGLLSGWSIVGMNHYHKGGARHLFVAMTRFGKCIQAEGPDDLDLWVVLERLAKDAEK